MLVRCVTPLVVAHTEHALLPLCDIVYCWRNAALSRLFRVFRCVNIRSLHDARSLSRSFSTQLRATRFRVPFCLVVATRSTCRLHIAASRRIGHDDYSPRIGSDVSGTLSRLLTTIRSSSSGSSAWNKNSARVGASSGTNRRCPRTEFRRG